MQSIVTSRYVLQAFLDELLEFDRDIAVARNIQVGDVADALNHLLRATAPATPADDRAGRLPGEAEATSGPPRRAGHRRPSAAHKRLRSRARA
jgi:hypothetical protein